MEVKNIDDGTQYGCDQTTDGREVLYYIQQDITGSNVNWFTWQPYHEVKSRATKSYKEVLTLLELAKQGRVMPTSRARVLRGFDTNISEFQLIDIVSEEDYYSHDL